MKKSYHCRFVLMLWGILCFGTGYAQRIDVRGRVADNGGAPLPGVAVTIKGAGKGVTTDAKGEYALRVDSEKDVLTFSFVGYETLERTVGKARRIDVTMSEGNIELEEVVVVGYGSMRRRDLTGAVSSVQASDIIKIPVSSAAEAITGKLPGVQVTTTEGEPGAEIKIRVRGGGSITQDNTPLYIVDGFPSDLGLEGVDPNDIQSIDVLKDASSTSIYGARGANGVIIITTKGGSEGRFNVSYNGYAGARFLSKTLPVLDSREYVLAQWERTARANMASPDFDPVIDLYGPYESFARNYGDAEYVDWQDRVFGRTAVTQSHNVSLNGGSKNTRYNFSYTHNDEEGILLGSRFQRNTFKFKFDHRANDRVSFSANGSYMDRKLTGNGTSEAQETYSALMNILQYRPVKGLSGSIDDLLNEEMDLSSSDQTSLNPVSMVGATQKTRKLHTLQFNAAMEYKVLEGLTLKVSGGYNRSWDNTETFYTAITSFARKNGGPSGQLYAVDKDKWNNSNILTYAKTFGGKHDLTVMVGEEANRTNYYSKKMIGNGFPNADIGLNNMEQAATQAVETNRYAESILSFFGRVNYSYRSKYLFAASIRRDGSSKFAKNNRYGNFPAASAAWRISEESFFKPLSRVVNNLKLRYSYGASGNNRIGNFLYSTNFTSVYYGMNNSPVLGVVPSSLANPDLKWETTTTSNFGLDFGLFDNRLNGSFEYYRNKTEDLLLSADIGSVSGYTKQMLNVGSTRNQGIEFSLNATLVEKKDLLWTAGFNISANRNRVLSLNRGQDFFLTSSGWGNLGTDYLVQVGRPIGLIYGYLTDGMYTADDFRDEAFETGTFTPAMLKEGVPYNTSQGKERNLLGQPRIKRIGSAPDSPTTTPDADRVVIGNTNPRHYGGFNTSLSWKGIDVSVFLNWVCGNDVYNATKLRGTTQMYTNQNTLKLSGKRYTVVDPQTGAPVLSREGLNALNRTADQYAIAEKAEILTPDFIEDGSFLRLNNVTLGYTFPPALTRKIRIEKLRIYVTGYNLCTFTGYSGYDPEADTRRKSAVTPGVDYSAYPRSRQFIVGLNVTF